MSIKKLLSLLLVSTLLFMSGQCLNKVKSNKPSNFRNPSNPSNPSTISLNDKYTNSLYDRLYHHMISSLEPKNPGEIKFVAPLSSKRPVTHVESSFTDVNRLINNLDQQCKKENVNDPWWYWGKKENVNDPWWYWGKKENNNDPWWYWRKKESSDSTFGENNDKMGDQSDYTQSSYRPNANQEEKNFSSSNKLQESLKEASEILGIDINDLSDLAKVKKCYKQQALKLHPDKHATEPEDVQKQYTEAFQKLHKAYQTILNSVNKSSTS